MENSEPQTLTSIVYGGLAGTAFAFALKVFNVVLYVVCLTKWGRGFRARIMRMIARYDKWEKEKEAEKQKKKKKVEDEKEKEKKKREREEEEKLKELIAQGVEIGLLEAVKKVRKRGFEEGRKIGVEEGRAMERARVRGVMESELS